MPPKQTQVNEDRLPRMLAHDCIQWQVLLLLPSTLGCHVVLPHPIMLSLSLHLIGVSISCIPQTEQHLSFGHILLRLGNIICNWFTPHQGLPIVHFLISYSMQKRRRKAGRSRHMNEVNVYLGRQRGGGRVPNNFEAFLVVPVQTLESQLFVKISQLWYSGVILSLSHEKFIAQ